MSSPPSLPGWMVHRLASAHTRLTGAGTPVTPAAVARASGLSRRAAAVFLAQAQASTVDGRSRRIRSASSEMRRRTAPAGSTAVTNRADSP